MFSAQTQIPVLCSGGQPNPYLRKHIRTAEAHPFPGGTPTSPVPGSHYIASSSNHLHLKQYNLFFSFQYLSPPNLGSFYVFLKPTSGSREERKASRKLLPGSDNEHCAACPSPGCSPKIFVGSFQLGPSLSQTHFFQTTCHLFCEHLLSAHLMQDTMFCAGEDARVWRSDPCLPELTISISRPDNQQKEMQSLENTFQMRSMGSTC